MLFCVSFSNCNCFQAFYSPLLKPNTSGHFCKLALATVGNDNLIAGFPTLGPIGFHLLNHLHALYHLTEDHMFSIKPLGLSRAKEKLRPVGVGTSISHRQHTRSSVLETEVLIFKLAPIDGLSTSSIASSEVTSLAHEVGNDPVES